MSRSVSTAPSATSMNCSALVVCRGPAKSGGSLAGWKANLISGSMTAARVSSGSDGHKRRQPPSFAETAAVNESSVGSHPAISAIKHPPPTKTWGRRRDAIPMEHLIRSSATSPAKCGPAGPVPTKLAVFPRPLGNVLRAATVALDAAVKLAGESPLRADLDRLRVNLLEAMFAEARRCAQRTATPTRHSATGGRR